LQQAIILDNRSDSEVQLKNLVSNSKQFHRFFQNFARQSNTNVLFNRNLDRKRSIIQEITRSQQAYKAPQNKKELRV
jgi:hypothetical protein